ncbi:hypothetical protein [Nitrobacter hamburgensis]|nr:hypothetical protein [Nitrobacter hamburgensis]
MKGAARSDNTALSSGLTGRSSTLSQSRLAMNVGEYWMPAFAGMTI